jgi:hypothetical protein
MEIFGNTRSVATKLLFPLDPTDLNIGGQYVFLDQPNYLDAISSHIGRPVDEGSRDIRLMRLLDGVPSLDPFILRETLSQNGFHIDQRYYELDEAVLARMEAFVLSELSQLVNLADSSSRSSAGAQRLVQKLLASDYGEEFETLRAVFRIPDEQFREIMFCWKGFLYYKWNALGMDQQIRNVINGMAGVALTKTDSETLKYLSEARRRIASTAIAAFNESVSIINNYNQTYGELIRNHNPGPFREFLYQAPSKFLRLGEVMGQLSHIVQFWSYRFPRPPTTRVDADEFFDILRDFEDGLVSR